MTCWTLAILATLALDGPDAPSMLVDRLGAPRFAEREAAAVALRALGREALPALREAREDSDEEVRSRSVALVDQLEGELLVGPTMIRLDGTPRTIAATFAEVARQGRLSLNLMPENSPMWVDRTIAPARDGAIPFWAAVDVLCAEAKVQPILSAQGFGAGVRAAGLNFRPGEPSMTPPRSDGGPFRVQLNALHHNRGRSFAPPAADAAGVVADSLYAELQVTAEPRMSILSLGALRLTEATDDLGQSLMATAAAPGRTYVTAGMSAPGALTHAFAAILKSPERPSKTLRRLMGTLPVVVSARRDEATVVDLKDAKGKTFRASDSVLVVNEFKPSAKDPAATTIDVSLRPALAAGGPSTNGRFLAGEVGYRPMIFHGGQFEILDARDRPYPAWTPSSQQFGPEESRFVVSLSPPRNLGPPAKIRFFDTIRASTEIRFDLRDVPLP